MSSMTGSNDMQIKKSDSITEKRNPLTYLAHYNTMFEKLIHAVVQVSEIEE